MVVSIIVAAAVILPLLVLVVSSFQVLDAGGFDTTWGLANYTTLFTDRVIPKAFVNTLLVCAGSTVIGDVLRRVAGLDQCPHQLSGARPDRAVQSDSVFPEPLRRRDRLAQSGRRQDRAAQ